MWESCVAPPRQRRALSESTARTWVSAWHRSTACLSLESESGLGLQQQEHLLGSYCTKKQSLMPTVPLGLQCSYWQGYWVSGTQRAQDHKTSDSGFWTQNSWAQSQCSFHCVCTANRLSNKKCWAKPRPYTELLATSVTCYYSLIFPLKDSQRVVLWGFES